MLYSGSIHGIAINLAIIWLTSKIDGNVMGPHYSWVFGRIGFRLISVKKVKTLFFPLMKTEE